MRNLLVISVCEITYSYFEGTKLIEIVKNVRFAKMSNNVQLFKIFTFFKIVTLLEIVKFLKIFKFLKKMLNSLKTSNFLKMSNF